jgi:hypothetical protein
MTDIDHVFIDGSGWQFRVIVKLVERLSISNEKVMEAELKPMHDTFKITYNPQFPIDTPQEEIIKELETWFKNLKYCGVCQHEYDVLCNCKEHKCGRCRNKYFEGVICACGWPFVVIDVLLEYQKKRKL